MIAILDQHVTFIYILAADPEDMEMACAFMEVKTYAGWQGWGALPLMEQHLTSLRSRYSMKMHSLTGRGITH